MKQSLRIFSLIGIVIFAAIFLLSFSSPEFIESSAKGFVKERLQQETHDKIDSLSEPVKNSKLGKLARQLVKQNNAEIQQLKIRLKNRSDEKLADVIALMSNMDCECRKKFAKRLRDGTQNRITSLTAINAQLSDFMKSRYMGIVKKLLRDFRIFSGSNLLVFTLLLLVSLLKVNAIKHLYLPVTLLFISSLVSSYFYLFNQNWFYTILYNDYVGMAYIGWLLVLFSFLCDITMNRAQITTSIINGILEGLGSAASVAPC